MKNTFSIILFASLLVCSQGVFAQATVGDEKAPESYSVLELISAYKSGKLGGMRLPQLTEDERDNKLMKQADWNNSDAVGLMIYNMTTNCVEFWSGTKWVSKCESPEISVPTVETPINSCGGVLNDLDDYIKSMNATGTVLKWWGSQTGTDQITDLLNAQLENKVYYVSLQAFDDSRVAVQVQGVINSVTDADGHTYPVRQFGFGQNSAGCWTTWNLRTKTGAGVENNTISDNATAYYYYPMSDVNILSTHPEYGLVYNWSAATGNSFGAGVSTDLTTTYNDTKSTIQGICPNSWVLPSDYDWYLLEKEIATKASLYSTSVNQTWIVTQDQTSNRGSHSPVMTSTTMVTVDPTLGTSYPSPKGFDGLLLGAVFTYTNFNPGKAAYFWTSTSNTDTKSWNRSFGTISPSKVAVSRSNSNRGSNKFSVRCKKQEP